MTKEAPAQSLIKLGFTGLEAEVYTSLLKGSPMTGYAIGQDLGKPTANVYKAIESLENKGMVMVDDGNNRMCRAIPAEELLSRLEREFLESKQSASQSLAKIHSDGSDDRVYQLRSAEQVFERARQMLAKSKTTILLDIFPLPFSELQNEIRGCAARGVEVLVKVYEPVEVTGAKVFLDSFGSTVRDRWAGQWLNVVSDSTEHLLAFLTPDIKSIHQAVWSRSAYLSCVYHSSIASEIVLTGILNRIVEGAGLKELRTMASEYFEHTAPRAEGYQTLTNRFGVETKSRR